MMPTSEPSLARASRDVASVCPVCGRGIPSWGQAILRTPTGSVVTAIAYCRHCDVFRRLVTQSDLVSHFLVTSYTQLDQESSWYQSRHRYFQQVLRTIRKNLPGITGRRPMLLDFGSAYGHLIDVAQNYGFTGIGVESNQRLAQPRRQRGLAVYSSP